MQEKEKHPKNGEKDGVKFDMEKVNKLELTVDELKKDVSEIKISQSELSAEFKAHFQIMTNAVQEITKMAKETRELSLAIKEKTSNDIHEIEKQLIMAKNESKMDNLKQEIKLFSKINSFLSTPFGAMISAIFGGLGMYILIKLGIK